MDRFTETYIKMVTKAKEIQGLCKYNKGDWFWNGEKPYLYCKSGLGSSNPHDYKWLPTLEDLFGILRIDDSVTFDIFFKAITNFYWKKISRDYNADSLQEMLLRIVMLNIFHKIWNPDKKQWEEINGS